MKKTISSKVGFVGLVSLVFVVVFSQVVVPASAEKGLNYAFNFSNGTGGAFEVEPGDQVKGSVVISLRDDVDAEFELEFYNMFGNEISTEESDSALNMSNWIEFANGKIISVQGGLPGVQEVSAPFIVNIPKNIAPGDYVGLLASKLRDKEQVVGAGASVSMAPAIGLKMKFSVPGTRVHSLEFLALDFQEMIEMEEVKDENFIKLSLKFRNLGNALIRPIADIKVLDRKGAVIYEKKHDLFNKFPSKELAESNLVLEGITPKLGWMDVMVELSYSVVSFDGKPADEAFDAGKASLRLYIIPWQWVLIAFLVVSAVFLFFIFKRFRTVRLMAISKLYQVKPTDTLQGVCAKFGVDSKWVIAVNKLKAPYFLAPNSKILIPKKDEK